MLSDKKICWTMNTGNNLLDSYVMNSNYILAPFTDVGKAVKCFPHIEELLSRKGPPITFFRKTTLHSCMKIMKFSSELDSDSSSTDSMDEKIQCSSCGNKFFCLCRECIINKIKFADKQSIQRKIEFKRRSILREIEKFMAFDISVSEGFHSTYVSIKSLKQSIHERKKAIVKKKAAIKAICSKTERYRKTIEELKERCCGHEKILCAPPNSLQTFVDACEDKLQKIVKFNAEWFLKIFPIQRVLKPESIADDMERRCQEMIVEACEKEFEPSTDKTLVAMKCGTSSEHCYTICGFDVPDRAQYKILKGWLNIGIPTLPAARSVHNMFAAFVYIIQLVNLLTVNFDVCVPEQISFQEFSSCRKWTEGLFDTDIFKLNRAVVMLCLSLGIESELIEPLNPFANLLLISNIVNDPNSVPKPGHYTLTNELAFVLEEDLKQICWAERERTEEDEWYMVRYSDNYYDEKYDISTPLKAVTSLSDLEEIIRNFPSFASAASRTFEHDFQYVFDDAISQHSAEFLPRVLSFFKNFASR